MKKVLIVAGVAAGAVVIARRAAAHCAGFDFEQMIDRMPENAPPRWMFRNISAIHANTERILALLGAEAVREAETKEPVAAA